LRGFFVFGWFKHGLNILSILFFFEFIAKIGLIFCVLRFHLGILKLIFFT